MKLVSKTLDKTIYGFILYDIKVSKKTPYIPYLHLGKQCIITTKLLKKKMPMDRLWTSVEPCDTDEMSNCVKSQSCSFKYETVREKKVTHKPISFKELANMKFPDIIGCENSKSLSSLKLQELDKVLIPYKFYTFTEYETTPYNTYQYKLYFKPNGLWFAVGDEWLRFIIDNEYNDIKYRYLYEVVVDKNKMIIINNLQELYEFSEKYGVKQNKKVYEINWKNVVDKTKKYGILINPNLKYIILKYKTKNDKYFDYFAYFQGMEWYLTWDVSSGAVWNHKAIKSFKLIYKEDDGHFVNIK